MICPGVTTVDASFAIGGRGDNNDDDDGRVQLDRFAQDEALPGVVTDRE